MAVCPQDRPGDRVRSAVADDAGSVGQRLKAGEAGGVGGLAGGRGDEIGDHVRPGRRLPGALVGVVGHPVQDKPERQGGRGSHDRQQEERGLGPAPSQVARGEAAHEQDSAHRSALQPGKGAETPSGAAGQFGLIDQRAVAHREQPVCGGRDPRIVGHDDQRLPSLMQALE